MPQTIFDVIDHIVSKNEHQGSDAQLARILCRGGLHHPREIVHALQQLGCSKEDIIAGLTQARISHPETYFEEIKH